MNDSDHSGPIDLQINGYAGIDFNAPVLTLDEARRACRRLKQDGVAGILVTLITDEITALSEKIARWAGWIDREPELQDIVLGLHIEGPFLNPAPGYAGAHNPSAMIPADSDTALRLVEAGEGHVRLVTLAPERDPQARVTRLLSDRNIRVAAGHTDATLDELRRGIENGLCLFTHLGNGCPALLPRHDNILQRVLHLADQIWISVIPDGIHLPGFVLDNFLKWIPSDRLIAVTDAMAAAGLGPGRYSLCGREVIVGADGAARYPESPELLAGSTATLPGICRYLLDRPGQNHARLKQFTEINPRRCLFGHPV